MDHLFAQSDLSEYARLDQQVDETTQKKEELRARFVAAAEKAKAEGKKIDEVTEPGSLRVVVSLGTKDNTSWKDVVTAIEDRNCVYTNGGNKMVQLNSTLPNIVAGKTKSVVNNRVSVKPNIR